MNSWKHVALLGPGLLLVATTLAFAGDAVDEERKVERDGVVQIHNLRGEVRILGEDRDTVAVTGELDDLATGFIFEVDGDETLIKVEMPRHDVNYGDGSDLRIRVPMESRVEFNGVSTDVTGRELKGGVVIRSVSGDIDLANTAKEIVVKSVSGDITVRDGTGRVRANSVSGDVVITVDAQEVSVDTVSGDIELGLGAYDRLSSTTVSGDQDVRGHLNQRGDVMMKSVSGEIDLLLRGEVNAEITVKTGPGGDIINDLTSDRPTEIFPARASLDTRAGDGSGEIRISSVSGDVHLRRGD